MFSDPNNSLADGITASAIKRDRWYYIYEPGLGGRIIRTKGCVNKHTAYA